MFAFKFQLRFFLGSTQSNIGFVSAWTSHLIYKLKTFVAEKSAVRFRFTSNFSLHHYHMAWQTCLVFAIDNRFHFNSKRLFIYTLAWNMERYCVFDCDINRCQRLGRSWAKQKKKKKNFRDWNSVVKWQSSILILRQRENIQTINEDGRSHTLDAQFLSFFFLFSLDKFNLRTKCLVFFIGTRTNRIVFFVFFRSFARSFLLSVWNGVHAIWVQNRTNETHTHTQKSGFKLKKWSCRISNCIYFGFLSLLFFSCIYISPFTYSYNSHNDVGRLLVELEQMQRKEKKNRIAKMFASAAFWSSRFVN